MANKYTWQNLKALIEESLNHPNKNDIIGRIRAPFTFCKGNYEKLNKDLRSVLKDKYPEPEIINVIEIVNRCLGLSPAIIERLDGVPRLSDIKEEVGEITGKVEHLKYLFRLCFSKWPAKDHRRKLTDLPPIKENYKLVGELFCGRLDFIDVGSKLDCTGQEAKDSLIYLKDRIKDDRPRCVVIYIAGHGYDLKARKVKSRNGDVETLYDIRTIPPIDAKADFSTDINSRFLRTIYDDIAKYTHLAVIYETCYSGAMARAITTAVEADKSGCTGIDPVTEELVELKGVTYICDTSDVEIPVENGLIKWMKVEEDKKIPNFVVISASMSHEFAWASDGSGLFTGSLLSILERCCESKDNGRLRLPNMSYAELFNMVFYSVLSRAIICRRSQHPTIQGNLASKIFDGEIEFVPYRFITGFEAEDDIKRYVIRNFRYMLPINARLQKDPQSRQSAVIVNKIVKLNLNEQLNDEQRNEIYKIVQKYPMLTCDDGVIETVCALDIQFNELNGYSSLWISSTNPNFITEFKNVRLEEFIYSIYMIACYEFQKTVTLSFETTAEPPIEKIVIGRNEPIVHFKILRCQPQRSSLLEFKEKGTDSNYYVHQLGLDLSRNVTLTINWKLSKLGYFVYLVFFTRDGAIRDQSYADTNEDTPYIDVELDRSDELLRIIVSSYPLSLHNMIQPPLKHIPDCAVNLTDPGTRHTRLSGLRSPEIEKRIYMADIYYEERPNISSK